MNCITVLDGHTLHATTTVDAQQNNLCVVVMGFYSEVGLFQQPTKTTKWWLT